MLWPHKSPVAVSFPIPLHCWCLLSFPEAELAALSPLPPVMLPQASALLPSKSNITATAAQQPEPESLREWLCLLSGYQVMKKGCQIRDWATSCGLLSPQTHSHSSAGQCISMARIWEGVSKSSCSHMFVLPPFACISLEFGPGSGSVLQTVHRRSAVHPLPFPSSRG